VIQLFWVLGRSCRFINANVSKERNYPSSNVKESEMMKANNNPAAHHNNPKYVNPKQQCCGNLNLTLQCCFNPQGKTSWLAEYKRLSYHTPVIQTEILREHSHQVLHVSFAHNGQMFATCSKDGYVLVTYSTVR